MNTSRELRSISWYIFWRSLLAGLVAGFILGAVCGFVIGFLGAIFRIDHETIGNISAVVGISFGIFASFLSFNYFLARSIGKSIGGRRLELAA